MSWFGNLMAVMFGPSQSVNEANGWLVRRLEGGRKTNAGVPVSEVSALTFPAVYAAVRILSGSLAQLPMGIYQEGENGFTLVTDHPLSWKIRRRWNPYMSSFTGRATQQAHTLLWGNGYAEIERNGAGQAINLWPLMSDRTWPTVQNGELSYRSTVNGQGVSIPSDDMVHVKALGLDGYRGLSPIGQAREAISMGLAMEQFGGKFFANDAKSGGFIMHPGKLGAPGKKNISDSLSEDQGGLENAHRVKILDEGMKFIPTTIPPEDAQFLASRGMQIEEVSRIFGVPMVLLSSHERTTSWGSGVEQLLLAFVQFTLQEWIEQWEEELTFKLFTPDEIDQGYCVRYDIRALLRGDMTARAAFYQSGIQNKWLQPNEARVLEGLNKIPGGDEFPATPGAAAPEPVKTEGLHE